MATGQQVQWQDVQHILQGQHVQQVVTGQYVLNIGSMQGGAINFAAPGQRAEDRIRPHPQPPRVLPRAVPGFLDRDEEQRLVGQALARGQVVDLNGPDGIGKTALIYRAMQTQLPSAFPDGLLYLSARNETHEDLLQELFENFYDAGSGHVKVTENSVRRYMAGKRALIVVDDANHLRQDEAEALAQTAPQCAFVVAGWQQQVWQGTGVLLRGLPRDQAVALFEQRWGRASAQDRPLVEAICDALDDAPQSLIKTATCAAQHRLALSQVLQQVHSAAQEHDPVGQAFQVIGRCLVEGEQQVLGGLAAPGGATVGVEALPTITGLPQDEIARHLARLQQLGMVHSYDARYSLEEAFRPHVQAAWTDEGMRARAADYYRQAAGQLHSRSKDLDEENVIAALDYYYRLGQWAPVVEIARAADVYLATAARWGQWRRQLNQAWQAATALGDRETEAWAQNQLGLIAMGLGDAAAATGFFQDALGIWQALGNREGITIARWNLQMLLGPPPPPPRQEKPRDKPSPGKSRLPFVIAGGLVILAIAVAVAIATGVLPPTTPITGGVTEKPPPPDRVTDGPPTPWIDVWLDAGCDREYEPGFPTAIHFLPGTNGYVMVLLDEREVLFERDVAGGETYTEDWAIPGEPGEHLLVAVLEAEEQPARGECWFMIQEGEPPRPSGAPDLIVVDLMVSGPVRYNEAEDIKIPVRVVVRNQGGTDADVFKVATEYTNADGTWLAAFTVGGQHDRWYPYTASPLAPETKVTFEGIVTLPSTPERSVSLQAIADSCASDEFMPDHCRVEESDEGNNASEPIVIDLP